MNIQVTKANWSCNFGIRFIICIVLLFLPLSAEALGATITYTYDNLNRLTKADYGNGTTEEYTYDAAGNRLTFVVKTPSISVTPASPFDFGTLNLGDSLNQDFIVSNAGDADLVPMGIYIYGTNAYEFSQTNNCTTLSPGTSCTII